MLFPKPRNPLPPCYPKPTPPLRVSILEHIQTAKTREELRRNVLRALEQTNASMGTRRKWQKAAGRKLGELRAQGIVRPGEAKAGGRIILPGGVT